MSDAIIADLIDSHHIASMFSFLFKRKEAKANKPASGAAQSKHAASSAQLASPQPNAQEQAKQQQLEKKQAALQQAASVVGNEAAALAFILACEFADARLLAAQEIHSQAALQQVLNAMRNLDRRVAKLVQQRLEALQFQQQSEGRALDAISQAEKLLAAPLLMTNHLSDLDRSWQALGKLPADMPQAAQFAQLREKIAARLQAQAQLQRQLINLIAKLKTHAAADDEAPPELPLELPPRELLQELAAIKEHAEAAALPRQLLPEAEQLATKLMQALHREEEKQAQTANAILACQQALEKWQQAGAESATGELASIQRTWRGLLAAVPHEQQAALQEQFLAFYQQIPAAPTSASVEANVDVNPATPEVSNTPAPEAQASHRPARERLSKEEQQAANQAFAKAMHALEAALQEGLLQAAFENDKILRDLKSVKPKHEQASHLVALRAELHRLQSWARWGGKVSREELVKAVEDLPHQELGVLELAKKVGSMRERWRTLDASAGPAPRPLWERFDLACSTAYAPAAEHFKKLAQERAEHAAQATAIIQQVQNFAASHVSSETVNTDWRAIASFCQKVDQQWHKLGSIERKERKRLDKEFATAMAVLTTPLEEQRTLEVKRREELITEVEGLQAHERGVLDQLRHLQERWQEMAKALPLARKIEQELWQRFHTGCDQVFAQRKESAHQEQQDRRQHQTAKEALCAQVEQVPLEESAKNLREIIKNSRQSWKDIGPVPRQVEAALETRFHNALDSLQQRVEQAARAAQQQLKATQLDKLLLCIELESAVLAGSVSDVDVWQSRWQALPKLAHEVEKLLSSRWQQALQAASDSAASEKLSARLREKQPELANEILRQEILHGIDSPAEFSRQRLQMQVQVLQSSLKSGAKQGEDEAKLDLYSLAAAMDEAMLARLRKLVA